MNLVRVVAGVVTGFLIFAISGALLFRLIGIDPHADSPVRFMILCTAYGVFFAAMGGYLAAVIAGEKERRCGLAVMILIDLSAMVSLAMTMGKGSMWSPIATMVVMSPAAALGGWARSKRRWG